MKCPISRRATAMYMAAVMLWLGMGFSLGWYYTITYYGRVGWPMPVPESCGALILYYFSVVEAATEIQAIHWMAAFLAAGVLWTVCLGVVGWWFTGKRPEWPLLAFLLALTSLPLVIPGPWLAWVGGMTNHGFSWGRMLAVALRRGNVSPWPSLSPLILALSILVLIGQVWVVRWRHPSVRGKNAWLHFLFAAILMTVSSAILGAIFGPPLRWMFE